MFRQGDIMADLEKRVSILESNLNALIKRLDMEKMYSNADNTAERKNISENTSGVAENGNGLLEQR